MILQGAIFPCTGEQDLFVKLGIPNSSTLVVSVDIDPSILDITGGNMATLLYPPYAAFEASTIEDFNSMYYEYLHGPDQMDLFAVLLRALQLGKNIILYQSHQDGELRYMEVLLDTMYRLFGIVPEVSGNDSRYDNHILNIMYEANLITANELIGLYDVQYNPEYEMNDNVKCKFINDTHMVVASPNITPYQTQIVNFIILCKNYNMHVQNMTAEHAKNYMIIESPMVVQIDNGGVTQ